MSVRLRLLALATSALPFDAAPAQCTSQWRAGAGVPGVLAIYPGEANVRAAVVWDRDGAGPEAPGLALAGQFYLAADRLAANVVFRDAAGVWSPLGSGLPGIVNCLGVAANGQLVAGGQYVLGTLNAPNIARWDGAAWQPLGAGVNGPVDAMLALPNGDLVVGGGFTSAGGVPAGNVARWDGASWSALGSLLGSVKALALLPNGHVVAGGSGVSRWDGVAWSPTGLTGLVYCLTTLANGDVVAGGSFSPASGSVASRIARWNGTTWQGIGGGTSGSVYAVGQAANGDIVAGGLFAFAGTTPVAQIARFDGSTWHAMGAGLQSDGTFGVEAHLLARTPSGDLLAGGRFSAVDGVPALSLAAWNGTTWSALASGTDARVRAVQPLDNGDLVVAGSFATFRGLPARRIVRRVAGTWQTMGAGITGITGGFGAAVQALAPLANGAFVAGGWFTHADGVPAANVVRWDGTTFVPLGSGVGGGGIADLAVAPNGDVVAAGDFTTAGGVAAARIARWDGAAWHALGSGLNDTANAVGVLPNSDVVACGRFSSAGGVAVNQIARWDGAAWHPLGSGLAMIVYALHVSPAGDVYAGGTFTSAGGAPAERVARWNGSAWSPLGSGLNNDVYALTTLPNGEVLAGGIFVGSGATAVSSLARWNGTAWSQVGGGVISGVLALAPTPDGFVAGGSFTRTNGAVSAYFGEFTTSCPPAVSPLGSGCASTGAANTLPAPGPVWAGGSLRTTATNLAPTALVGAVYGFSSTALPLASVLPAGPSCTLWAAPDFVEFRIAAAGSCTAELPVPYALSLAGVQLRHQMVSFGFDATGALVDVGATDAFTVTIAAL